MRKTVYQLALLLILPTMLYAQNGSHVRLGFFGGWGLPTSPEEFTDLYNGSFTLGGEVRFKTASRTTLVGRVAYHRFAIDEQGAEDFADGFLFFPGTITSLSVEGGNARTLAFTGNIFQQLNQPGDKAAFFLCAGAGLYNVTVSDLTINGSYSAPFEFGTFTIETEGESQTEFGVSFGLGVDTATGKPLSLFLESRYNMVFTDILDVDNAYFFSVLAGLNFRIGTQ